ncbi:MAG: RluA family pseudouridine synthase [Lachnospiraceae bacterium]|nr:RluA family pseudouridine synthase [Lachnospiraceae bacterium]
MSERLTFTVSDESEGLRIDSYLASLCPDLSRSYIKKLIDDKRVLLNGSNVKASLKVSEGDTAEIDVPELRIPDILPEDIDINVRYEDDDILIVYKPQNMVVHPAPGNYTGTLVNGLLKHLDGRLSGINGVLRPGIVHRIDKDTSGLLVICKNDVSHRKVAEQLKEHTITRRYLAVCCGNTEDDGTINKCIARNKNDRKKMAVDPSGKEAITHFKTLERFKGYSLIECRLETGRTHQIRVHMASIGHPVLGDEVYGGYRREFKTSGQTLHAWVLGLNRPSDDKYIEFKEDPPEYFERILSKLREEYYV